MPHPYLLTDLERWRADGVPVGVVLSTSVALQRTRPSPRGDGPLEVVVHAGGYGPQRYATTCRATRLSQLSPAPLHQALRNLHGHDEDDGSVIGTLCPDCLVPGTGLVDFRDRLNALGKAQAFAAVLNWQLDPSRSEDDITPARYAWAVLRSRRDLEFDCADGVAAPTHPDVIDPDRVLGPWWENRRTIWLAALAAAKTAAVTKGGASWDGPMVMLCTTETQEFPPAGREQGAFLGNVTSPELVLYLATADVAGYLHRPGMASSPVFLVPEHAVPVVTANGKFVSLGRQRTGADLDELLAAFTRVFSHTPATNEAVAALVDALELDAA